MTNGTPGPISAGCAWGVLLIPVVFFGGSWLLGAIVNGLQWVVGN